MRPTYQTRLTKRVARDLEAIHSYVAKDSDDNASALVATLLSAMESLAEFPKRFPVYSEHADPAKEVRRMPVGNYLIYYRIHQKGRVVEMLHVRHAAQDQPRNLG